MFSLDNMMIGLSIGFFIIIITMAIMLRGYMKQEVEEDESYRVRKISGREIEEIRRVLMHYGMNGLLKSNVLDLIYTIRAIQIGDYEDMDPYVPDDPYDGIGEQE